MPEKKEYRSRSFPAIVVKIYDDNDKVVINRGERDGVKINQRFMIYKLGNEDIEDPETKESLGKLEIVRGHGKVIHVQEKIATIESLRRGQPPKRTKRATSVAAIMDTMFDPRGEIIEAGPELPFDDPELDDLAKPL